MTNEASRNIPRRTLAAGAAWSVPAVAFAAKANAQASSGSVTLSQTGACKSPGGSCATFRFGYRFTFSSVNTHPCAVTVTSGSITLLSGEFPSGGLTVQAGTVIPQGTAGGIIIQTNGTNSGNVTFTATLTINYLDCNGVARTSSTTVTVAGTPPDCPCVTTTTSTTAAPTTTTSTTAAPAAATTEQQGVEQTAPAEESLSTDGAVVEEETVISPDEGVGTQAPSEEGTG